MSAARAVPRAPPSPSICRCTAAATAPNSPHVPSTCIPGRTRSTSPRRPPTSYPTTSARRASPSVRSCASESARTGAKACSPGRPCALANPSQASSQQAATAANCAALGGLSVSGAHGNRTPPPSNAARRFVRAITSGLFRPEIMQPRVSRYSSRARCSTPGPKSGSRSNNQSSTGSSSMECRPWTGVKQASDLRRNHDVAFVAVGDIACRAGRDRRQNRKLC